MRTLGIYFSVFYMCLHACLCKQLLIISGGGQLLGNDDGITIPLGPGLHVGNSYKFNYL